LPTQISRYIEGYVIASADGMIADAHGKMPDSIRNDADQSYFQDSLDRAGVLVHGRHSHEGGPRADRRKRIILTRRIARLAPDPAYPHALSWNPSGASLDEALAAAGIGDGPIAVIGGTAVFGLFLPLYNIFHLSHAARARIPGGQPVFPPSGGALTPEERLTAAGLRPGERRELDAAAGVSVVSWERD